MKSVGACRGGENKDRNAGLKLHRDLDCHKRCTQDPSCGAYVMPVSKKSNWCETYTSVGATGDGRTAYECYTKGISIK